MHEVTSPQKSHKVRNTLLALAGVAVIGWLGHFIYHAIYYAETDDAFVAGHVHQVSAEIGGPVQAVLVHENQTVQAGEVLVQIDPLEFSIAGQKAAATLAQAHAQEAQAHAAAVQANAGLKEAEARVLQASAQLNEITAQAGLSQVTRDRDDKLLGSGGDGAVTQADVDNARSAYAAAQAAVAAGTANVEATRAGVASAQAAQQAAKAQASAAQASIAAGEAAVRDAGRKLAFARIVAPVAGRIGNKNIETGDRVQVGQTLLALVEPDVWVIANFKETQLGRIRPGQAVEVSVDALPDMVIRGTVESVAPASGAQFALLPADNATGNFTKVVQRVPVKILLDPDSLRGAEDRVRPGLSVVVNVRVR